MAYSELVKNFNKIRDYMREFYVYGFKSRDEFTKKSARSYDDEFDINGWDLQKNTEITLQFQSDTV